MQMGLGRLIVAKDDESAVDADGDGVPDEVAEVICGPRGSHRDRPPRSPLYLTLYTASCEHSFSMWRVCALCVLQVMAALWEHYVPIDALFIGYGCAPSGVLDAVSANAWSRFGSEFKLARRKLKNSHLDQIFVAVNAAALHAQSKLPGAGAAQAAPRRQHSTAMDDRSTFSRAEWLAALVHVAIARFVASGEVVDVSEAVTRLLMSVVLPAADPRAIADPNEFRRRCCYTREVTNVIEAHKEALKAIFTPLAGRVRKGADRDTSVGLGEWLGFLKGLRLIGSDLTERGAMLSFVSSRMCVVDGSSAKGASREAGLEFEGFLEALVRISPLKALPTDDEIQSRGMSSAWQYLKVLGEAPSGTSDASAYATLTRTRGAAWGHEPTAQPLHRCVHHLLTMIVCTIEADTAGKDDGKLTASEVSEWMKRRFHGGTE